MSEYLLDGKVACAQPEAGYRAGLDAVLLGASIHLKPGQRALDLGTGSGAAMLVAAYHNPGASFDGIDIQDSQIDLAQANIAANGWADRCAAMLRDVQTPVDDLYDAVMANPPFFDDDRAIRPPSEARGKSFVAGEAKLADWVDAALRMCKPHGFIHLIHRAEALQPLIVALSGRAGDIRVRAIQSYADEPAKRVLIRARKAAKAPLRLLPPLILHQRSDKVRDYLPEAEGILNGTSQLTWG